MASISNAYLSQVERGLHAPSVRVLHALADVLEVPVEDLVNQGELEPSPHRQGPTVESAIRTDLRLDRAQKDALLTVYRSFVGDHSLGAATEIDSA